MHESKTDFLPGPFSCDKLHTLLSPPPLVRLFIQFIKMTRYTTRCQVHVWSLIFTEVVSCNEWIEDQSFFRGSIDKQNFCHVTYWGTCFIYESLIVMIEGFNFKYIVVIVIDFYTWQNDLPTFIQVIVFLTDIFLTDRMTYSTLKIYRGSMSTCYKWAFAKRVHTMLIKPETVR